MKVHPERNPECLKSKDSFYSTLGSFLCFKVNQCKRRDRLSVLCASIPKIFSQCAESHSVSGLSEKAAFRSSWVPSVWRIFTQRDILRVSFICAENYSYVKKLAHFFWMYTVAQMCVGFFFLKSFHAVKELLEFWFKWTFCLPLDSGSGYYTCVFQLYFSLMHQNASGSWMESAAWSGWKLRVKCRSAHLYSLLSRLPCLFLHEGTVTTSTTKMTATWTRL